MYKPSWRDSLQATLTRLQKPDRPVRWAMVGIGHELRGDDGAGVAVARRLLSHVPPSPNGLVIEAGPAPENHLGPLTRFQPDLVVLIDAADLGEAPGTVCWLRWQDTTGLSASTHTLPPHVLAQYLVSSLGCEVAVLGVQPADNELARPLSPWVQQAVETVGRELEAVWLTQTEKETGVRV